MVVGYVPVDAGHQSEELVVAGEVVIRTGIPAVHRLKVGGKLLHVRLCHTRDKILAVFHPVLGCLLLMQLQWGVLQFRTYEEEEFVLDNRSAECQSADGALDVSTRSSQLLAIHPVASKTLVLIEMISRTTEYVCSLLRHGIDCGTHEVAVLHVEG